jgi:hypothetical protein
MAPSNKAFILFGGGLTGLMNKNLDIITCAVSLIIKAAVVAARQPTPATSNSHAIMNACWAADVLGW